MDRWRRRRRSARPELEWQLEAVPGATPAEWPSEVVASHQEAQATTKDDPGAVEAAPFANYGDLVDCVESRGQVKRPTGVVRTDYARSAAARGEQSSSDPLACAKRHDAQACRRTRIGGANPSSMWSTWLTLRRVEKITRETWWRSAQTAMPQRHEEATTRDGAGNWQKSPCALTRTRLGNGRSTTLGRDLRKM